MAKIKICLDAGHYGKYNRSPADKAYYESEMNWKLHNLLKKYLEQYGFEVVQTRPDQAKDLAVTTRGKKAAGCNLFLSIHSNAVGSGVNESVDYPVVYVPLNGSGNEIGKKLADCITSVMGTKQPGRISTRKGISGDYYGVIRGAVSVGVPGLILEHSFHTNTRSTKWLLDDSNLDKMARAEADVIAAHFGLEKPAEVFYRVQVGAYSVKANAENMQKKLKADGYDAIIVEVKK
jgi:N-acetylmuramoyl-L-alanine amidase